MRGDTSPYLIFAGCAVVAWFGTSLVVSSGSTGDRSAGLFLAVVFGLGAVALPIVRAIQRHGRGEPPDRPG